MYLCYVDESGDCGLANSPTRYFVLSGLVVHELRWSHYLDQLIEFRRDLKTRYGLKLRQEIHSSGFITRPGNELLMIKRNDRLAIIRMFADFLSKLPDSSLINVVVDKSVKASGYDVFSQAWKALIQRFENTISHHNFPGPANADERGLIICDNTDDKKLITLLRQMRRYNPIPNQPQFGSGFRNLSLSYIVEDPVFRDSEHHYFIQAADLAAFLLYQRLSPNTYMRRHAGGNYFLRLNPILCKVASGSDPHGIVRL